MEIITSIVLGGLFGITQKIADQYSDKYDGNFVSNLLGVLEGVSGLLLLIYIPEYCEYLAGLLIYWTLTQKIDCKTHVIGICIIVSGYIVTASFLSANYIEVLFYISISLFIRIIKKHMIRNTFGKKFFKLYMQSPVVSFAGAFLFNKSYVFLTTISSITALLIYLYYQNTDSTGSNS